MFITVRDARSRKNGSQRGAEMCLEINRQGPATGAYTNFNGGGRREIRK